MSIAIGGVSEFVPPPHPPPPPQLKVSDPPRKEENIVLDLVDEVWLTKNVIWTALDGEKE